MHPGTNGVIDEFQSVIVKNRADMEKSKKKKEELEIRTNDLEAPLKNSKSEVKGMEHRLDQLQKEKKKKKGCGVGWVSF